MGEDGLRLTRNWAHAVAAGDVSQVELPGAGAAGSIAATCAVRWVNGRAGSASMPRSVAAITGIPAPAKAAFNSAVRRFGQNGPAVGRHGRQPGDRLAAEWSRRQASRLGALGLERQLRRRLADEGEASGTAMLDREVRDPQPGLLEQHTGLDRDQA